jgi:hypothetical protein
MNMSMSEFDEQQNSESNDILSYTTFEQVIPPDFGEDDLAFAHELNSIFSPEQEELPPFFVQTLLASEDEFFRPVESGFEHKTRARVFRRLKLRRRIFQAPRSAFDAFKTGLSNIYARGSLLASIAAFTLVMLVTVAFTAPSFTSGMAMLLHGTRGGVFQVSTYPTGLHTFTHHHSSSLNNANDEPRQITLFAAQQQMHFEIYWPQSLPRNYSLDSIYLYHGTEQSWSDGPIIELVYNIPGARPKGTGQIVIREFMPTEQVLPVVLAKAVNPIQVDRNGLPAAIFVNGQWVGKYQQTWYYGERSELIYQRNGILFWIAGDQYDGIGKKALWTIAQSLKTIPFNHMMAMAGDTQYVTQAYLSDVLDPFTQDPLRIISGDNPASAYYLSVRSDPSEAPIQKIGTHGH